MLNNQGSEGTYILPPNNGNIPEIPLIVEEAWYYTSGADANVIALFGNTNQQIYAYYIGYTAGGNTPTSNLSTFVQFEYWNDDTYLKSAVTNSIYSILSQGSFSSSGGTVYSYLIVNSIYAQAGYYIYNSNQVWAPLTLLDTYLLSYNPNYGNYTYSILNYNPYQYPTLEISAGDGGATSYQYVEWVVVRAYPPNGVMPSINIGEFSNSTTSYVNSSTLPLSKSSRWYNITIVNTQSIPTPSPFQQDIGICNGSVYIGLSFAYIDDVTLFNEINPNGQNVYFTTNNGSAPNIYSWYEGQLSYNGVTCDVWWIKLPNGIPANSKITIYMHIGNSSDNYYQQYYPYVGAPIQILGTSQYDNGQSIFNYYQNFGGLNSLPTGWTYIYSNQNSVSFSTKYTIIPSVTLLLYNDGITTTTNFNLQNNILEIYAAVPITSGTTWDVIDLGAGEANSSNSYFVGGGGGLIAGGNNDGAAYTYFFPVIEGNFYLYVGTSNVGTTIYSYTPTIYEIGFSNSYTYFLINYIQILSTTRIPGSFNLPITIGQERSGNNIYLYWVLLRSLPPNDIMPSIYIS
jgi:hypothetical protein